MLRAWIKRCGCLVLTQAMIHRVALEDQLLDMADIAPADEKITEEFLVTKTISNKEVWDNLEDWEPSIKAEYQQLVTQKEAVRQMTKSDSAQADRRTWPSHRNPALGKMVHTRKAVSGAFRSRAVVCGNYENASADEKYAGGADGDANQNNDSHSCSQRLAHRWH